MIFALKARHAYWEDETPEGGNTNMPVNINLPSARTPEEYHHMMDMTLDDVGDQLYSCKSS